MEMGKTTHKPTARYRVLATYWEAESYVECWTEQREAAERIALVLKADTSAGDVSVQVDVVQPDEKPATSWTVDEILAREG